MLLAVASVALVLGVLEVAVRIERGQLFSTEQARKRALGITERPVAVPDARLGHIPTPNLNAKQLGPLRARVTTDAAGVRWNGSRPLPKGSPILVVGDSFTYGLDVHDEQTWPADLERLLARPVWNGAVFGYGLDQIVLRAEQLLDERPGVRVLVIGLFGDDVERCEYSYLFAPKPWFEIVDGALVLRNVPVPETRTAVPLEPLRRVLAYSHLADLVLTRAAPSWWIVEGAKRREHDRGDEVAALLIDRVADVAEARGNLRVVLVMLLPQRFDPAALPALDALAERARARNIEVIDLAPELAEMARAEKQRWLNGTGHFSPEANAWVAERIADHIRSTEASTPLPP